MGTTLRNAGISIAIVAMGGALALPATVAHASTTAAATQSVTQPSAAPVAIKSVKGGIGYMQNQPLPKDKAGWWTLNIGIDLALEGVAPNTPVEVRMSQPSSGWEGYVTNPWTDESGAVSTGWGQTFFSLTEAQENLPKYTGPMTVEVRVNPDDAWVTTSLSDWTVRDRLVFKNVSMKKKGKTLTFKGKVTTAQGVPVSGVGVQPVLFKDYSSGPIGEFPVQKTTNSNGGFTVKVKRAKRGTVGMMIVERPDGASFDWTFSRTFRNR